MFKTGYKKAHHRNITKDENMNQQTIDAINTLGNFCGKRDIEELTSSTLTGKYNIPQADIFVLFGGSIICGGDVLAQAIQNKIAKHYIIVGGAGHTTQTLREKVHTEYPSIVTEGLTEAEIFNQYLKENYGLEADYLENKSTNCGNNITYLLDLIKEKNLPLNSIILCQDATMQHRMEAGLRKYVSDNTTIINYASYQAKLILNEDETPTYSSSIHGMWQPERYLTLLMGEIPRLSDNKDGYGPKGTGYITHVDIPEEVMTAFNHLKGNYAEYVREANPEYAG